MQSAFQSLHEHEQRDVVLTLLQPSMLKFLDGLAQEAMDTRARMTLPNVIDASACQQYVADVAKQQERLNFVRELQALVQNNVKRFVRES